MPDRTAHEVERLPRGRHGLSREEVTESQRRRLLTAMVEVVAEQGYPELRVVDVIERAGVSRKTFYELYEDKEECFLDAYDGQLGVLLRVTSEGFEASPEAPWAERARRGLGALLAHLAAHPQAARFCIVEVQGAGPKALARRDAMLRRFSQFLDAGRAESTVELPGITSIALFGGINELLYSEIIHGATAQLPSRLPEIMFWVVHPFLGAERAAEERDRARRSPPAEV